VALAVGHDIGETGFDALRKRGKVHEDTRRTFRF